MLFSKKARKTDEPSDISRAKRLYFSNYASYETMKRNGEYEEYMRYSVPDAFEREWSGIVLGELTEKIQTGEDIWLVSNLANVRTDDSEILKSFRILSKSPNAQTIMAAVEKSEPLIPHRLFERIKTALLA